MISPPEKTALLSEIIEALASVAPEARELALDPDLPLREQIELDSMDHLHFTIALHERFGVDIPEADYAAMRRLRELESYIAARRTR
jgi:acyl carrier protein